MNKLIEQKMNSRKRGSLTWDQLSILVYAGAMSVSKIGNQGSAEKQLRSKEWFRKSNVEVESLRKTIGKATAELNRRKKNAEVASRIFCQRFELYDLESQLIRNGQQICTTLFQN